MTVVDGRRKEFAKRQGEDDVLVLASLRTATTCVIWVL
jgi:hypothetical protein